MVSILKSYSVFQKLTPQTLYMLAFEVVKVKKFKRGQIIGQQSKRSPINFYYKEFFENRMSNLQLRMTEQEGKIEQQRQENESSQYHTMMQLLHRKASRDHSKVHLVEENKNELALLK